MKNFLFLISLAFFHFSCDSVIGNKDLKIIYFPDSEIIKQSVEYKEGRKNGTLKEYFRNGHLKAIQRYVNDTLNDTSFFFMKMASAHLFRYTKIMNVTAVGKSITKKGICFGKLVLKIINFTEPINNIVIEV